MLELIDVRKVYTTKAGDTIALKGVSIKFADKGMVFISGKSGCGKTTLLNSIGGLDKIDGGEIIVDGKKFSEFTPADYDSYRNTMVGFVFQEYNLLNEYSIEKNINIADELQGRKTDNDKLRELLKKFEIADYEKRKPNQLSGGQKQRVAIVRALIKNPKIILADEPTGALDSATGIQVMDLLKELSKEKLVIVVSHENSFAEKYADRIIRIVDGQVVEDVSLSDVAVNDNVFDSEQEIIVKSGAKLNESETKTLVTAIEEKKKIRLTEKITVRQRKKTEKIEGKENQEPAVFIKSRMKFKSIAGLGMKSLVVKPFRLIITILLSVIAFAVFGIFDSVASYNGERALSKLLSSGEYNSVSIYNSYNGSSYDEASFKMSQSYLNKLNKDTGYSFRGIYEIVDEENIRPNNYMERRDFFNKDHKLKQISAVSYTVVGREYYTQYVNGFVEFGWGDISNDGTTIKGYNYKIIPNISDAEGGNGFVPTYPELMENDSGLQGVGISKYLAESIRFWSKHNKDKKFNDIDVKNIEDLYGQTLIINDVEYCISAIIDCGEVPEKYEKLKTVTTKDAPPALTQDFTTYLNSSCNLSVFVPNGFVEQYRAKNNRVVSYIGDYNGAVYDCFIDGGDKMYNTPVFYNVNEFTNENTVMFNDDSEDGVAPTLANNEVLISARNIKNALFEKDLINGTVINQTELHFKTLEDPEKTSQDRRLAVKEILNILKTNIDNFNPVKKLVIKSTAEWDREKELLNKELKVVGVYFDVNIDRGYSRLDEEIEPIVLSTSGLKNLNVNTDQGIYSRAISTISTSKIGANKLSSMMSNQSGFKLVWYQNGILEILEDNSEFIGQFLDLFLYIAIAMITFSIFMLFNYISTSIVSKRQSIGVLRALGTGGKSIFLMFLLEGIAISLIGGLLASLTSYIACIFVNDYILEVMNLTIKFVLFGGRQIAIIVASSLATGFLASLIPIIRIVKEKPVALIRKD